MPAETFYFSTYFILFDQVVQAGNTLNQNLFLSTLAQSQFNAGFTLTVNLGSAIAFTTYSSGKVVCKPLITHTGGIFKVILTVKSLSTGNIYSANYKITVNPVPSEDDASSDTSTDSSSNSTETDDGSGDGSIDDGSGSSNSTNSSSSGGSGTGSGINVQN